MIVVSDAGPLHYLILIGEIDLLPRLYERVVLPTAVLQELRHSHAPLRVRQWASDLPDWAEARSATALPLGLNAGEQEAISLAMELRADLLLMDDRQGRTKAKAMLLPHD